MKTFLPALFGLLLVSSAAQGQGYPAKPVRLVVPFAAGGAVDTVARVLGQKLTDSWKQPVLVDNRPGAGGNIAADAVAKAPADGYTYLITTHGFTLAPGLYKKLPYDPLNDFAPVTQLTSSFLILVANPRVPAASLSELIALAKTRPGGLNYGSTGIGAPPHIVMELLKGMTGTDMLHVPYKGDALLNPALLSGEVQVGFLPLSGALQHVKSGRLRALAITSPARSSAVPEVPTIAEAGVPQFEHIGWLGVFAPAKTPREAIEAMRAELARALMSPDIRDRLPGWGYEPVASSAEAFAAKYKADLALYAKVIKDAGIPLQE
jgi:tripartite-type tricarboxylate transporter receptor subunit TctC